MSWYSKLRGTVESIFQIGKDGPQFKEVGTDELHLRNSDDSNFGRLKVAAPVDDLDAVNKIWAESLSKPIIIKDQVDTSTALPDNTAARRFLVVTTPGNGAAIGDILYDNGLNDSQPMEILAAEEGRAIAVTDTLSGGDITLQADSIYMWDTDGAPASWIKVGDIGNLSGAGRVIRFPIANTPAVQDSTQQVPAGAVVHSAAVKITTSFSGGATIAVGNSATANLLQLTSDNKPQASAPAIYDVPQDTEWGGTPDEVRATIGNSPAAGAGYIIVHYSIPDV